MNKNLNQILQLQMKRLRLRRFFWLLKQRFFITEYQKSKTINYTSNMLGQFKFICVIIVSQFYGCSDLFEYSPYDTPIKFHGLNQVNAEKIKQGYLSNDTLKFALISDTHSF